MKEKNNLKKISVTAMLCALAYICMFVFKFKVGFLTFDLKDAVLTVIAFLYGPIYGVVSSILVALIEFVSVSDTGFYGLVMNALSSAVFTASIVSVKSFSAGTVIRSTSEGIFFSEKESKSPTAISGFTPSLTAFP